MPGRDGAWLLQQIRGRGVDTPFVALTGHGGADELGHQQVLAVQADRARVEAAEPDEPGRAAEVAVEQRQIAPGGVVGDVSDLRVYPLWRRLGGQFAR